MKILEYLFWGLMVILFIDFIGFLAWGLSGQFPVDNCYIGAITKSVLHFII